MDEEPRIVEMKEDEWLSPEDLRLLLEEKARLQKEKQEAERLSRGYERASNVSSFPLPPGQWSTVLSDLALVLACVWAIVRLWNHPVQDARSSLIVAMLGFGFTGLAAACGCFRFAGVGVFLPLHEFTTMLAKLLGLPLIAVGVVMAGEMFLSAYRLNSVIPFGLIATTLVVRGGFGEKLGMPLSSAAGLMIAVKSVAWMFSAHAISQGLLCLGGFVLALLAGFFVRPTTRNAQYVPFVLGVDVFHYLYALAMVLMGIGIDLATTRAPRLLLLSIIY